MTVRKRGSRYHYDFRIRGQGYRGAIPEARTKGEAQQAEVKLKNKLFERKFGKTSASRNFTEFVTNSYLPWAKANKRSSRDDQLHSRVFFKHFGNRPLNEIDRQMIEDFKIKRMNSITRYSKPRKPASVNGNLRSCLAFSRWQLITKRSDSILAGRSTCCLRTIRGRDTYLSRKRSV